MNLALDEIASTSCKDDSKDKGLNNNIILLALVILVLCGCGSKNFLPGICGIGGDPCCKPDPCCKVRGVGVGGLGGGLGILLIILICCLGKGEFGLLGKSGNVNTNVINVARDDECYDDDYL